MGLLDLHICLAVRARVARTKLTRERQAEGIAPAKGKYTQTRKLNSEDIAKTQAMVELGLLKTQAE